MAGSEKPRIGVFVCHCGLNIAGVVDVEEVTEYAKKLPNVVYATHYRYMCADPGQKLIKDAIKEHGLNRVVVAACSPRLHEPTFRRCVAEAGLNPYLFEMANIREHCSWCHSNEPDEATKKAKDLVKMAVAKARLLEPLKTIKVPVTKRALVIGGGITGINAALDLANLGFEVYLVEKSPSIGGHMAQLDKTFPTLDCAACILTPRMVEVARHPNIRLLTYSEVVSVEGYIGNYKVKVLKKPRYVDESKCTGCGTCMEKCPKKKIPDEFNAGLGYRTAIYIPFPQAVPRIAVIDPDHCLYLTKGVCRVCEKFCQAGAIDFSQQPEEIELEVGVVIVATGFEIYRPTDMPEFGYGKYPDVLVGLEFERLLNVAGPTGGRIVRPSDGKEPKRIVFIQCVGSRGTGKFIYCSGFCCMYSIKQAVLAKEHIPDTDVYILYTDMRTNFKGYEEFYRRARELGVKFIRVDLAGRRVEKDPQTGELVVRAVTEDGRPIEIRADMVVLASTAVPRPDAAELARKLNIPLGPNGFFMEAHPKLKPVDTAVDGIFVAGACQYLKDIPYSVSQGAGAAARAATILSRDEWEIEPIVSVVDPNKCRNVKVKCGICATKCPYGAIEVVEGQPARVIPIKCHGCGTCAAECPADAITQMHFTDAQILSQVRAALEENPEDKILAFCCNWCSYAGADLAGTSRFEYPPNVRIIRVMCSGRVDRDFVLEAFRLGAGMVLIAACHLPYDCHYISGNVHMTKRMETLAKILQKLGLTPERFRVEYISAAEGSKFAEVITQMTEKMKEIGKERIIEENKKLKPAIEKMLARKAKT